MVSSDAAGMKNDMKTVATRAERERDRHAGEQHQQGGAAVEQADLQRDSCARSVRQGAGARLARAMRLPSTCSSSCTASRIMPTAMQPIGDPQRRRPGRRGGLPVDPRLVEQRPRSSRRRRRRTQATASRPAPAGPRSARGGSRWRERLDRRRGRAAPAPRRRTGTSRRPAGTRAARPASRSGSGRSSAPTTLEVSTHAGRRPSASADEHRRSRALTASSARLRQAERRRAGERRLPRIAPAAASIRVRAHSHRFGQLQQRRAGRVAVGVVLPRGARGDRLPLVERRLVDVADLGAGLRVDLRRASSSSALAASSANFSSSARPPSIDLLLRLRQLVDRSPSTSSAART